MNKYLINTTDIFEEELENIFYYIAFVLNEPNIAKKLYKKIKMKILSLEYLPQRYTNINSYNNKSIRKMIIDNFIIIYKIEQNLKQVYILHIFHCTQNYFNQI